ADDRDAARALLELEETVRRDAVLGAGKIRHVRVAARRNQNVGGRIARAGVVGHLVRSREAPLARDHLDVPALEIAAIDVVQTSDVRVAASLELPPVVAGRANIEAVIAGVPDRARKLRRVPHHLLRHAADVYARASKARRLEQDHLDAVIGRALGGREAAAAPAQYDQIE